MIAVEGKRPSEGVANTNKRKGLTKSKNDAKKLAGNDSMDSENDTSIIFSEPREDELDIDVARRVKDDLIVGLYFKDQYTK